MSGPCRAVVEWALRDVESVVEVSVEAAAIAVGALAGIYSLLQGRSLEESCEFANKSAALSVTKKGAATSMPKMEEVRSFYKL